LFAQIVHFSTKTWNFYGILRVEFLEKGKIMEIVIMEKFN